jgi:hypothetical protein
VAVGPYFFFFARGAAFFVLAFLLLFFTALAVGLALFLVAADFEPFASKMPSQPWENFLVEPVFNTVTERSL